MGIDIAIAVSAQQNSATQIRLRALAQQLQLPVCDLSTPYSCTAYHFYLSLFSEQSTRDICNENPQNSVKILGLASSGNDFKGNIYIDFVRGKLGHRRQFGGGRGQALAKAIGMKHGINPAIIDATAGLGRDAFILASLGAQVTMIERSPILAALLEDGLQRLAAAPELSRIAKQQLHLVQANAIEWLQQASQATSSRPDIVYLDPMYPHRSKSALVKKEMRALRALVGDDEDAGQLLQAARQCALKRVVVKRPKGAPLIDNNKPSGNVQSKNTRYDIYSVFVTS